MRFPYESVSEEKQISLLWIMTMPSNFCFLLLNEIALFFVTLHMDFVQILCYTVKRSNHKRINIVVTQNKE